MPGKDDDLLARLNALKPSSVTLKGVSPSIEVEASRPQSVEDKLAHRLKNLRAKDGASEPMLPASDHVDSASALTAQVADEVATERDPIKDWQQQDGSEQTLDELIAELGDSNADWALDPDESEHVEALLREASTALPAEEQTASARGEHGGKREQQLEASDQSGSPPKTEDQQDEEEADEYVRRILAELEFEEKSGEEGDMQKSSSSQGNHGSTPSSLDLPSTPSTLKETPSAISGGPPSYEDSELEVRLSRLGMSLPSTPTNRPSSSKPKVQATLKPRSNLPVHTDEDIESWCCICNSDGELRCLGCDGDIYCAPCWNSGHGRGAGQERGHRAIAYAKRRPQPQQ